jgi:CRP-like cAMP-binding protein
MLSVASEQVRSALQQHGDLVGRESGAMLFEEGESSTGIYLVLSGTVQTSVGEGSRKVSRLAGPGSLLGIPATINGTAYSISASVKDQAELVHISRPQLLELMRTTPAVSLAIIDMLSQEIREMRQEIKKPKR